MQLFAFNEAEELMFTQNNYDNLWSIDENNCFSI